MEKTSVENSGEIGLVGEQDETSKVGGRILGATVPRRKDRDIYSSNICHLSFDTTVTTLPADIA